MRHIYQEKIDIQTPPTKRSRSSKHLMKMQANSRNQKPETYQCGKSWANGRCMLMRGGLCTLHGQGCYLQSYSLEINGRGLRRTQFAKRFMATSWGLTQQGKH